MKPLRSDPDGGSIPVDAGEISTDATSSPTARNEASGAFTGWPKPDYQGGGLVNLMSSLIQARGGRSAYPALTTLSVSEIAGITNLILLVIDGLGAEWLERRAPDGLLSRHRRTTMTSVFPPTTAAAIPTFLTGQAPQQHGLTGWHTWLRELGTVMTVLPGRPRYGGPGYREAGLDPAGLFEAKPLFEQIDASSHVLSPTRIAHSDFNRAYSRGAQIRAADSLTAILREARKIVRRGRGPQYLYLYWPELDRLGHEQGIEGPAAWAHLHEIERAIADFLDDITGSDTLLLVTADHGQLDTTPAEHIELADHADLADCLILPLCGEPRAAFCYLRPDRIATFLELARGRLDAVAEAHASRDLIAAGLFGSGPVNRRLADRIGDYTLLMRGSYAIHERLLTEEAHTLIGVHGGLSTAELHVPLCLLRA
ncbi:nucleotide pyrophosphatase/phosphodiesterase family protein [Thioalkalicoccus limnaeus]|uniref:Nucleotide pyrophosphatase/phosphodiesterase family protein n=1 Tax=Thioalkalicoccus limnaeus TaxID=120681 RepID=A0ABV4BGL7_9GAMM